MPPFPCLRSFLKALAQRGELAQIDVPVSPHLEIAEIHRRAIAQRGPALLFNRVEGSSFPVVTNLFGTKERCHLAFGGDPELFLKPLIELLKNPPSWSGIWQQRHFLSRLFRLGQKRSRRPPLLQCHQSPPQLDQLPLLTSWPLDGGPFITLPLVYTQPPDGEGMPNLGMYRIQRYDAQTTGLHCQIGKGAGYHLHRAQEMGKSLPVSIFLGGPPALILSAIAPLPENLSELLLASFMLGKPLEVAHTPQSPHPLLAHCEFALCGEVFPDEKRLEGPFGDHYGYYSLAHDFPVFHCRHLFCRRDAIYPATIVGKPPQEDLYIGDYLQQLLSPLFPLAMPGVKDLWSYGQTGYHSLAAAVVKERFEREALAHAFRILGEGQLALTKFLLLTDQPVPLRPFSKLLPILLERFNAKTDLYIFSNLSLDTLDYTGPSLNKGSRAILLGMGEKKKELPTSFLAAPPSPLTQVIPFCPGCLLLQGPSFAQMPNPAELTQDPLFAQWPLLVLVDDANLCATNEDHFLWSTFTRFEPAADIYSKQVQTYRHHLCYETPLLIDARTKPSYPLEVECDEKTAALVSSRWHQYFPLGLKSF